MRSEELNRPVLELGDSHSAKRFLNAFIECRDNCVGQELGLDGEAPIDQEWNSATDGRAWTFSGFAYTFLSFDIVLDGFLTKAPHLTASEIGAAQELPMLRTMMHECAQAARQSGNSEILELTDQVVQMLGHWEEFIRCREDQISQARK